MATQVYFNCAPFSRVCPPRVARGRAYSLVHWAHRSTTRIEPPRRELGKMSVGYLSPGMNWPAEELCLVELQNLRAAATHAATNLKCTRPTSHRIQPMKTAWVVGGTRNS